MNQAAPLDTSADHEAMTRPLPLRCMHCFRTRAIALGRTSRGCRNDRRDPSSIKRGRLNADYCRGRQGADPVTSMRTEEKGHVR